MVGLRQIHSIVAMDSNRGIGKNGNLPWRLPNEFKYFVRVTSRTQDADKRNACIMGRATWLSIPDKFRPLPGRLNVVLSRTLGQADVPEGVEMCSNLDEAMKLVSARTDVEDIFAIGGGGVYSEVLKSPHCGRLYVTKLEQTFDCDTYYPEILAEFQEVQVDGVPQERQEEKGIGYRFCVYERNTLAVEE